LSDCKRKGRKGKRRNTDAGGTNIWSWDITFTTEGRMGGNRGKTPKKEKRGSRKRQFSGEESIEKAQKGRLPFMSRIGKKPKGRKDLGLKAKG